MVHCRDEIALLTGAGTKFDRDRFLAGQLTPVFFGSALTNFGVEPVPERVPRARRAPA